MTTHFNNPQLDNIKIDKIFNMDLFIELIKTLDREQQNNLLQVQIQNEKINNQNALIDKNSQSLNSIKEENERNNKIIIKLIREEGEKNNQNILNLMTEFRKDNEELLSRNNELEENLKKANTESLEKLMDIGPKVAESIYNWFHQKRNLEFLEKLEKVGVKIISQKSRLRPSGFGRQAKVKTQKLKGLIFVLTGQLQSMTRAQAKEKIRSSGAKVLESVSGNINYAVVGKNPGSTKLEKAEKLKIKIMGEKEFLEMIK